MIVSAELPTVGGKAPHLMCGKGDVADIVLLPGDPGRVDLYGEFFDSFEIIASNREYKIGTGIYKGVPVSVCSTGIGAPSTEIAVVELIELGAKALIRTGGTGTLDSRIACGDMVVTTASLRKGGSSCFYAPPEYPAVASREVTSCLADACANAGIKHWEGISASVGSFFAGQGRSTLGKKFFDENMLETYKKLNILNMEMESETIMVLGSIFGVLTGSICAVHANRVTDEWMEDFREPQRMLCRLALEGARLLHERHLK